jgi:hypothetical protein
MKKLLAVVIGLICATSLTLSAADAPAKKKKQLTPEQKQVQKEMLDKYDTNKDGKLDKQEKAKMTQDDKDKMEKAGLTGGKKKTDGSGGAK